MLYSKENKQVGAIFNIVILLLSLEYVKIFGYISVFQSIIIPLCIFGLFVNSFQISGKNIKFIFFVLTILALTFMSNAQDELLISFGYMIGVIIFVCFLLSYLTNNKITKETLFIISLYSLPHIFVLLRNILFGGISNTFTGSNSERFAGFHKDPNFMCVYINLALISKFTLIKLKIKQKYISIIVIGIFLDMAAVLYSNSRSGIIISIISVFIFYWLYNKKIFGVILVLSIPILIWIANYYLNLVYTQDMSLLQNILWRIKQSTLTGEIEDGRIGAIRIMMSLIDQGDLGVFGYPITTYIERFGYYPHNTFLDIILAVGLPFGTIATLSILYYLIRAYRNISDSVISKWLLLVSLNAFLSFAFLSMYQLKVFWFMFILLFYSASYKLNVQRAIVS
jgi:hypothetical protein